MYVRLALFLVHAAPAQAGEIVVSNVVLIARLLPKPKNCGKKLPRQNWNVDGAGPKKRSGPPSSKFGPTAWYCTVAVAVESLSRRPTTSALSVMAGVL